MGVVKRLYRDSGKEHGKHYIIWGLGFRVRGI